MANHEAIFRGDEVMKSRASRQIVIFGVGANGSQLADHLTRMGFRKMAIFDKDRVDADNVFSQIYNKKEQGVLKVEAMKTRIFLTTGVTVETEHRAVTKENIAKIVKKYPADTVFIDCFDNEESRRLLYDNIPGCLHLGLAENYCEVVWNERYRVPKRPDGVDVCEYPQARSLALIAVAIAAEVVSNFMATGKKQDYCFTLGDLKISPY